MSLATKYRPRKFEELVEQSSIRCILENQIQTKTHQNCYLFCGGAGTGKTTSARIFATLLNNGIGNPIEIDAASNNGVDNVRQIIQDSSFKSIDSEYKVYIIDEAHMLSTGAFNALLKLFEEPPAKSIFIMCTTDPQKIPATILSRVQRFDFKRISQKSIINRLIYIINSEVAEGNSFTYTEEAIEFIAKLADGGMRDSITLLDKCLSYTSDLTLDSVISALGTANYDKMCELTEYILRNEKIKVIETIESIHKEGVDLKQFIKQYSNFVLDLCKYQLMHSFEYTQVPRTIGDWLDRILQEAPQEFALYTLDELIALNTAIKWDTNPKPLIESKLLLLCR